jgi:transposase
MKVKAMNRPMDAKSIPRRKYDKAFKQQAVELWMSSGKSAALVAAELGIKPDRLFGWKKTFAPPPPGGEGGGWAKSRQQLQEENESLRRELDYVRQQRDILKKTLGILSEAPNNGINGLKP